MSSYNLRPTSYSPAHLDRELALRGAHTSGSTERKRERLTRFVEAGKEIAPPPAPTPAPAKRAATSRPVAPPRRSSRIAEQNQVVEIPTVVRRSSRISALLGQYLGY